MLKVLKNTYNETRRNYRQHILVHIISPFLFFTNPKSTEVLSDPDKKGRSPFLRWNLFPLTEIYRKNKLFNNINHLILVDQNYNKRRMMLRKIKLGLYKQIGRAHV